MMVHFLLECFGHIDTCTQPNCIMSISTYHEILFENVIFSSNVLFLYTEVP